MGEKILKSGSPTLFFIIRIVNLVFGASAIALLALSIWLWQKFHAFNIIEIVFIALGVLEFLLVLLLFTSKKSVYRYIVNNDRLRCYVFLLFLLFIA